MNTKTYLYLYTKFTHMKHEYKTDITQSLDTYIFMTYVRVIVNQKANIAMNLIKTKDIILNSKSEIKSHFAFLSNTWVFRKVMSHFELRNTLKISCLL